MHHKVCPPILFYFPRKTLNKYRDFISGDELGCDKGEQVGGNNQILTAGTLNRLELRSVSWQSGDDRIHRAMGG
jgi:hypothetical protein